MIRSMYSGISGMKNFQTKLDVIGNNIANVNTYGFKKGRVTFKDMVNQTISGASGPSQGKGGINPKQVGLGSQLAAIDTIDTQGSLQTTGRVLDLAIQGDGYLVVAQGTPGAAGFPESTFFTRAGNVYLNNDGYLVTATGQYVMSTDGTATPAEAIQLNTGDIQEIKNLSISEDGKITFIKSEPDVPANDKIGMTIPVMEILLFRISQSHLPDLQTRVDLKKLGKICISIQPILELFLYGPGSDGAGMLVSGALEMSNVDLSEEFTEMIVAQRGFQANTRIITTSDEILQELVNLKR